MYRANLQSIALAVPKIINGLQFWVGVANPQSCGRGSRRGSLMVPFERAFVGP